MLPRYVRKFVNWLDSLVPMQLSEFTTAASWGIISFLSAIVIASVGLSIATSLGGDTANIWSFLEEFGKDVLTTAVPRMIRVLVIVFFAWLAIRVFQRAIPTLVRRFLPRQPESQVQVEAVEKRTRTLEGVLGETKPIRQWEVAGEFRKRVKIAFDKAGIEIPFPHRTIYWGTGVETQVREGSDESRLEPQDAGPGESKKGP